MDAEVETRIERRSGKVVDWMLILGTTCVVAVIAAPIWMTCLQVPVPDQMWRAFDVSVVAVLAGMAWIRELYKRDSA